MRESVKKIVTRRDRTCEGGKKGRMRRTTEDRDLSEYLNTLGFAKHEVPNPKNPKPFNTLPVDDRYGKLNWDELRTIATGCEACKLSRTRTNVVFGSGNPESRLVFIGEGPGADEDAQGLPFVGRSGQLLTKMIEAMGVGGRAQVYITNVVKCRPPENRNPQTDEISACSGYLRRQIEIINPKVIVGLGTFAGQSLLQTETPIGKLRGKFHVYPVQKRRDGSDILVMPTYHPAFCLRNPNMKKPVWEDLQLVMKELGDVA